jgi:diguanylate cyclase (GGDEF)-like protein
MVNESQQLKAASAIFDSARLPACVMSGSAMIVTYANSAFSNLTGKNAEDMVGRPFAGVMPQDDGCLLLLNQVLRNGKYETHTEHENATPHPYYWSYEIWPLRSTLGADDGGTSLVFQITETAPLHRRASVMNEALLLSAVRQHTLMEEAVVLNNKLTVEIRERQRVESEIEQLAFYDHLTGLPNRRLLMDRLHLAIVASSRTMHHGAVLFIDLDHFKNLNDTRGHHIGDVLLQQVALRLKASVRADDTVARLGGDEFVVMLKDLSNNSTEANAQAERLGTKILAALNEPYLLEDHYCHSSGSIGIALFSSLRESVDELLNRADLALYKAKSAGGNAVFFFDPEMQKKMGAQAALEADLRRALQRKEFVLHYQPQVDDRGVIKGVEALLRWQHPERGLLYPSDFIASAEEHGIIEPIGLWVLEAACHQLMMWNNSPEMSRLTMSINVSAREFGHLEFVTRILMLIDEIGADPTKLVLEFTERVMFGPLDETIAKMKALKARGLTFALDDFGIGFSSLTCLKSLPISQVKIDRSFVSDVLNSRSDGVIVSAIIALGEGLGLTVIAEGIETKDQQVFLLKHGCRFYQGFFFGRPQSAEQLTKAITSGSNGAPRGFGVGL